MKGKTIELLRSLKGKTDTQWALLITGTLMASCGAVLTAKCLLSLQVMPAVPWALAVVAGILSIKEFRGGDDEDGR